LNKKEICGKKKVTNIHTKQPKTIENITYIPSMNTIV
jgi:hypothetical protein